MPYQPPDCDTAVPRNNSMGSGQYNSPAECHRANGNAKPNGGGAVPAVALRANTRNPPSAYLGRNRVPRDGVEKRVELILNIGRIKY